MARMCRYSHPLVWLKRLRNRKGYGIHSPFAFEYITYVIYERTPYYIYKDLVDEERRLQTERGREWACSESLKLKRLLFRMVNRAQPDVVVEAGPSSSASLYIKGGKAGARYFSVSDKEDLDHMPESRIDFLYLHATDTRWMREVLTQCLPLAHAHSVFAIQGIGWSKACKQLWNEVKQADGTGITFDLYDLGILMFNPDYNKQDYIINF